MPLDKPTIQRLYLVRQMVLVGTSLPPGASELDIMQAVLTLDVAVDTVLTMLLASSGKQLQYEMRFPDKLKAACINRPALEAKAVQVEEFHGIRNRVTHRGFLPHPVSLAQIMVDVENFVLAATRELSGRDLKDISPALLIIDDDLRIHLLDAEDLLTKGQYTACAREAALAFVKAWAKRSDVDQPASSHQLDPRQVELRDFICSAYASLGTQHPGLVTSHDVAQAVVRAAEVVADQKLQQFAGALGNELTSTGMFGLSVPQWLFELDLARTGIDVREFYHFKAVAPLEFGQFFGAEELIFVPGPEAPFNPAPSREDAMFALNFAARALLHLQTEDAYFTRTTADRARAEAEWERLSVDSERERQANILRPAADEEPAQALDSNSQEGLTGGPTHG